MCVSGQVDQFSGSNTNMNDDNLACASESLGFFHVHRSTPRYDEVLIAAARINDCWLKPPSAICQPMVLGEMEQGHPSIRE